RAIRLCDGVQGTLWMFDCDRQYAAATAGVSAELANQLREPRDIHPYQQRLRNGERVFQIPDLLATEAYRSGHPLTKFAVEAAGVRSAAFVALVQDTTTVGGFTIAKQEVRPFNDKQIALLENFAAQAVIAMENVRLITETREALEQQTATTEVLQVINSSPGNLAPVFDAMLEKAMRLCDASMGVFTNFDGNRFKPRVSRGVPPRYAEYLATTSDQPSPDGTNQRVLAGENVAHVTDLMEAIGYRTGHPWVRALVELGDARTLVTVALRKDAALLGTITLYRREVRSFSNKE